MPPHKFNEGIRATSNNFQTITGLNTAKSLTVVSGATGSVIRERRCQAALDWEPDRHSKGTPLICGLGGSARADGAGQGSGGGASETLDNECAG